MVVVCTTPFEGLRAGSTYRVNGSGWLDNNSATDKKGWGVCLEDEWVGLIDEDGKFIKGGWEKVRNKPYSERVRWVYATLLPILVPRNRRMEAESARKIRNIILIFIKNQTL